MLTYISLAVYTTVTEANIWSAYRAKEELSMSVSARTKVIQTHLQCPECKNIVTIYRRGNRTKEKNHLKHMYCFRCKDITGHIEGKDDLFLPQWLIDQEKEEEMMEE
jgi:hypothetical protein